MARPKKPTDELKDQRVPIMMSEEELKAIDDWRFDNRISSRGEAIRRLCQIGLILDQNSQLMADNVINLQEDFGPRAEKIAEMLVDLPTGEKVSEFATAVMELLMDAVEKQQYLVHALALVFAPAERYKQAGDFADAQLGALAAKADYMAKFLQSKVDMYEVRKKRK